MGGVPAPPASYPQTVTFDVTPAGAAQPCGRAVYSSYHTLPNRAASTDPRSLAPHERILEYLMLEAAACVGP